MIRTLLLAATLAAAGPALAAPSDDARRHFQAIADNDVDALAASYDERAIVEWVGGPLDGQQVFLTNQKNTLPLTVGEWTGRYNGDGVWVGEPTNGRH